MLPQAITNLEKLLNGPRDGALLRYSLGNEYLKLGETEKAAAYFQQTVERDPRFSAGWKLLGKALMAADRQEEALAAYERGIQVATQKGDVQAAKEMGVFVRRLKRLLEA
ncbi:MAG: putative transcriptional regulator [Rhodocyclaceae bacterium]|nr:putative transcriptional regulator [Rhodocyclaceae bacterium]